MIDLVLFVCLMAAAIVGVRRVRQRGFEGLVPGRLSVPLRLTVPALEGLAEPRLIRDSPEPPTAILEREAPQDRFEPEPEPVPPVSRRFVAAWICAAALLVIAVLLQKELWLMKGDLTPFWGLLAIGVAFAATVRLLLRPPEHRDSESSSPRSGVGISVEEPGQLSTSIPPGPTPWARPRGSGWRLIAVAAICQIVALTLFATNQFGTGAWLLHLVAGPMFGFGVMLLTKTRLSGLLGSWTRLDLGTLLLLVAVALALRLWEVGSVPMGIWFDEAVGGMQAIRIAAEPSYRPVFIRDILQGPAAYWYLVVPFIGIFGQDPLALRLPAVLAGALGVGAMYILARILFDRPTALLAGGLAVGLTWHLNFSRVAFLDTWTVALDAAAVALFALGLRRSSPAAFAAAGLVAGWGIHFYYASQLLPIALGGLALHRLIARRGAFLRLCGPGLVCAAAGFLFSASPILHYAVLHPQDFTARAQTVSVLREVEQAGSWQPLIESAKAHLFMFNVRGDPNGRHNWTGRPMLDGLTGALFILGFALALAQVKRWEYALLAGWVPFYLLGGILSISWEAPQAHRTIDEVTAVSLLSALPLAALWRGAAPMPLSGPLAGAGSRIQAVFLAGAGLARTLRLAPATGLPSRRVVRWSPVGAIFGVAAISLLTVNARANVETYFTQQQRDYRTWTEFSAPQTQAGREINEVPLGWKIYLDPILMGNPPVSFLVKDLREFAVFDPAANLPVADDAAAIFLTDRQPSVAAQIVKLYPTASKKLLQAPEGRQIGLYSFFLSPADVQESRGVLAEYRAEGAPVVRRESRLDFAWPRDTPIAAPFSAALETTLTIPSYGMYGFRLEGPPDTSATIDGLPLAGAGQESHRALARGNHTLRVETPVAGGEPLRLLWTAPQGQWEPIPARVLHIPRSRVTGLLARLYRGTEPSGEPASEQVDPTVELRVHLLPLPRPYTIEWTGAILAEQPGTYRIGTTSIDDSTVWVDGQLVVSNTVKNSYRDGTLNLTSGWHDIRVRFLDATSFTHISLYWEPPGKERSIVPSDALRPWPVERMALAQPADLDPALAIPLDALAGGAAPDGPLTGARSLAPPGSLMQPRGVAMGTDGTVYVADAGRQSIVAFTRDGGQRVLAEGQFREPSAVAALADGTLAVADAGAGAIWRMDANGNLLERMAPGQGLYSPRGLSAGPDGRLVVADTGNNRLLVLSPTGNVLQTVAGVKEPTDAAFLPDGTLLVAETGARQLVVVKISGERVANWSMPQAYTVVGPHVAVVPAGGWLATSPETRSLLRMGPRSRSPESWTPDASWLKPVGIAVGPRGVVVVDAESATASLIGLP